MSTTAKLIILFTASLFSLCVSQITSAVEPGKIDEAQLSQGWISLFDGKAMPDTKLPYGWKMSGKAEWAIVDGEIHGDAKNGIGFLYTTCEFADVELSVDFKCGAKTNSGVFLHTVPEPKDPKAGGDCYEVNIAAPAVSPFPTGNIVGQAKSAIDANATDEKWHTMHVTLIGDKITTSVDDKKIVEYKLTQTIPRGHIAIQANSGTVAFRNLKMKPLGAKPLLNRRDLTGWKVFPDKKCDYSITQNGELEVKNGPGMLESEKSFADFVLQWEVKTNGKNLNSGIFFRQIPNEFTLGYECQIHNGYKDNDRTKPLDCGSGGFYRRQDARFVNGNDNEWTRMTLVVHGPHMAAWVNGVQVSDWTDTRKPDPNPRKGLRTDAGTLSIQGHDPTTDILFRNIQIAELPPTATK
jgi:hypothetical protein